LIASAERLAAEAVARESIEHALLHSHRHLEPPQHQTLVRFIGDSKAGLQANVLAELAKELGAERVDGAAPDRFDTRPELARETIRNLASGLVGECENANARRCDAELVDQKSDALDQAIRFAGDRPSDYEQWLEPSFDRRALRDRWNTLDKCGVDG